MRDERVTRELRWLSSRTEQCRENDEDKTVVLLGLACQMCAAKAKKKAAPDPFTASIASFMTTNSKKKTNEFSFWWPYNATLCAMCAWGACSVPCLPKLLLFFFVFLGLLVIYLMAVSATTKQKYLLKTRNISLGFGLLACHECAMINNYNPCHFHITSLFTPFVGHHATWRASDRCFMFLWKHFIDFCVEKQQQQSSVVVYATCWEPNCGQTCCVCAQKPTSNKRHFISELWRKWLGLRSELYIITTRLMTHTHRTHRDILREKERERERFA